MNRKRKGALSCRILWIVSAAFAAAVVIGVGLPRAGSHLFFSKTNEPGTSAMKTGLRRVLTETVSDHAEADLTTFPGATKASQASDLAFRVGGPLIEVKVKPGDHVSRGDVLMRIDPRDFETAAKAAEATLVSAQAKLKAMKEGAREEDIRVLEAKLAAGKARRDYVEKNHVRYGELVKKNAIARQQMDSIEAELEAAVEDVRALEKELEKAQRGARLEDIQAMEADIRGMEAQLQAARDALEDTRLLAPFDGTVTQQLVENHEQVAAGQVVVGMHNVSTIEIEVDLPEKELVHRRPGDGFAASVRFAAVGNRLFEATLHEMNTKADQATKTYKVTFAMPAPNDVTILPGMVAEVQLESRANEDSGGPKAMVPAAAVMGNQHGNRFVWVVADDSTVQHRNVELGWLSSNNRYIVQSGIHQGERVVISGAAFLHNGEQVLAEDTDTTPKTASHNQLKPRPSAQPHGC